MDIFDQKAVLESFRILVDTREQDTPKATYRYRSFGCPYGKATLRYGDYAYNAVLPSRNKIYDESSTITPLCAIERKMDLDELAGCFTRGRERFTKEFERAAEHGARIYLICENATWEKLIRGEYKSKLHPNAFLASIEAWMVRYNMNVTFCEARTSGRLIKEILYRDLKERLEKGEFDGK